MSSESESAWDAATRLFKETIARPVSENIRAALAAPPLPSIVNGLEYPYSVPFKRSRFVPEGTAIIVGATKDTSALIVLGTGRVHGEPYTVPGVVWRGYILDFKWSTLQYLMVDSFTGKLHWVNEEDMIPTPEALTAAYRASTLTG